MFVQAPTLQKYTYQSSLGQEGRETLAMFYYICPYFEIHNINIMFRISYGSGVSSVLDVVPKYQLESLLLSSVTTEYEELSIEQYVPHVLV